MAQRSRPVRALDCQEHKDEEALILVSNGEAKRGPQKESKLMGNSEKGKNGGQPSTLVFKCSL